MPAHPSLAILKNHIADTLNGREPELGQFLIDLFDSVEKGQAVVGGQLAKLKEIASDKREWVSNFGRVLLGKLAERNEDARGAIIEMAHSSSVHVRFNAVLCLNEKLPPVMVVDVISLLIKDKSIKVREKAADWVGNFNIDALVPVLEQALAVELNPKVKQVMAAEASILRNGYYVLHTDSGESYMVTPSPQGRVMRKIEGGGA